MALIALPLHVGVGVRALRTSHHRALKGNQCPWHGVTLEMTLGGKAHRTAKLGWAYQRSCTFRPTCVYIWAMKE